jgi:4-hydroxy-2-oxoheptanedioate aldolase
MPEYLTAREIQEYYARGQRSLLVDRMPFLTDEAKEVIQKLGFQIIVRPEGKALGPKESDAQCPAVCSRPSFKERLSTGKQLVGTFIQTPHPVATEFAGKLGFDFLLIDTEHSAMRIETVQSMLQSLAATPTYAIIRIPSIRPEHIASSLDAGADAIVVPQVRTVKDVVQVQNAALYPPEGKRGIGPGRATDFGLRIQEKKDAPNKDIVVVIQIETKEALDHLDELLAVTFYDMVFVGPGDLSMNLGIFGEFSHPLLTGETERVFRRAKECRKKTGIFAPNVEFALKWLEAGVDLVTLSSDLGLLAQSAKKDLSRLESVRKPFAS